MILRTLHTLFIGMVSLTVFSVHADEWSPITGKESLEALYSGVVQEGDLTRKAKWRTEYCANGTGIPAHMASR